MANYPKPSKGSRHNAGTGYRSGIRAQLREDRRVQAKVRQELRAKRSPEEQVARLNAGHFHASKERARLAAAIEARLNAEKTEAAAPKKARKEKRA